MFAFLNMRIRTTVLLQGRSWGLKQPQPVVDKDVLERTENYGCNPLRDWNIEQPLRLLDHSTWFLIGFLHDPKHNWGWRDQMYIIFFYRLVVNNAEQLMKLVEWYGVWIVTSEAVKTPANMAKLREALAKLKRLNKRVRGGGSGGFNQLYSGVQGSKNEAHIKFLRYFSDSGVGNLFQTLHDECNCKDNSKTAFNIIEGWDKTTTLYDTSVLQGFTIYNIAVDLAYVDSRYYDPDLLYIGPGSRVGAWLTAGRVLENDEEVGREMYRVLEILNGDEHVRELLFKLCPVFPPGTKSGRLLSVKDVQGILCAFRKFGTWESVLRTHTLTGVKKHMRMTEYTMKNVNIQHYQKSYMDGENGEAAKYEDGVRVNAVDDVENVKNLVEKAGWVRSTNL